MFTSFILYFWIFFHYTEPSVVPIDAFKISSHFKHFISRESTRLVREIP